MPTTKDPDVTVAFLRHDNPAYAKADDAAFAEYSAAHTNVKITATNLTYPALGSTLLANLKNNSLDADLVRIQPSWVCSFADNLADVPTDVATLSEAQNAFFAAPLAGSTCDGKLKGLPMEYNLEYGGVVVNVDKYQAKYPGKMPNWTDWNAFLADASALTEYDAAGKPAANGLDIAPDWPQPAKHIFFSQILQRGGNYWSASGNTFDFHTPEARASLEDMIKWVNVDKVMFPSLIPDKNTFVTTRLATGATGYGWSDPMKPLSIMGYCGTWGVPDTISQKPMGVNTRYDYYTLPPMAGSEHKFVQNSGWALAVPKTSKNQKAAWDIVKAIALSPAAMKKWSSTTGSLPALKVNGTAAAAASDPMLAKVQPLLEKGQWVGYIPAQAIETVEGAIVSNFFDAASGKKTIEQALMDMEQKANNALAQYR
jgi:multiple sugar transport system substrate-binding protein